MIGLCVDSNAQLPDELRRRYGVEVVALIVTIDGRDYLEGVDLDADGFYARFATAAAQGLPAPAVTTAAPSPGQFATAYDALAGRGATEILSVHLGSNTSGTVNSARLGAQGSPVPVRIVDTGTASFAITCCLWEAASAIENGASLPEAAEVAQTVGAQCDNVFVVGALDLARAGGRLAVGVTDAAVGVPVLSLVDGRIEAVAHASSLDDAADAMARYVRSTGTGLRVGLGIADPEIAPLWQALESRLTAAPEIQELVRYRIGPSVGAHTGPGTAGAVSYPTGVWNADRAGRVPEP